MSCSPFLRATRMILDGKLDHVPEPLFYMAGAIEDVLERYEQFQAVD